MKRLHVHVAVEDIGASIRFYSHLFAAAERQEVYARLRQADRPVLEEGATTCCYAKSEKSWIEDPQAVKSETFLTTGESTIYGTRS